MNARSRDLLSGTASRWHYTRTAVWLHWSLAVLLAAQTSLGWYMLSIEDDPGSGRYFWLHKSTGLVIATLVVVRIFWRLTHPRAPLPDNVATWESRLAWTSQALLYVVMVLMPAAGLLGAGYSKSGVPFFGLMLPRWAAPDHDLAERFFGIHSILAWVLVALVALHVLGAFKHLLLDRDGVFRRMWRIGVTGSRRGPAAD